MKCIPLSLILAANLAVADLILMSARSPIGNQALESRDAICPASYAGMCRSADGDAVCMAIDEFCCQLAIGTNPYVCPATHPYCCPSDASTGNMLCGSNVACSGPVQDGPSHSSGVGRVGGKEGLVAAAVAIGAALLLMEA